MFQTTINKVFVELGYNCNFQCNYCFQRALKEDKNRINPKDFNSWLKKIVDELPITDDFNICFYGGEPFLYKNEINEIIEFCDNYNIGKFFSMTTNGSLLTKENIQWCKKRNILINLSLDGAFHTQIKNRLPKEKIDYHSFVQNILHAIDSGLVRIIQTTVPHDSLHLLYETYLYVKTLRVPTWHYSVEVLNSHNWGKYELRVLEQQLKKIIFDYLSTPKKMRCVPIERILGALDDERMFYPMLYVNANGQVRLGRELPTRMTKESSDFFVVGNIYDSTSTIKQYSDLFIDKVPFTAGQIMNSTPLCPTCQLSNYCLWDIKEGVLKDLNEIQSYGNCLNQRAILFGLEEWKNAEYLPL